MHWFQEIEEMLEAALREHRFFRPGPTEVTLKKVERRLTNIYELPEYRENPMMFVSPKNRCEDLLVDLRSKWSIVNNPLVQLIDRILTRLRVTGQLGTGG